MKIYVLGLDKRTAYCAAELIKDYENDVVLCDDHNLIYHPDVVVLPYVSFKKGRCLNLPECVDSSCVLDRMPKGSVLFAGMVYPELEDECRARSIKLVDYFSNESLTVKNAYLTAEGALEAVMRNTDFAVFKSRVAIAGFGRVARACAELFSALCADVTVLARRESSQNEAVSLGYKAADIWDTEAIKNVDVIINTVPSMILNEDMLRSAKRCKYILDLASAPYGTDFGAARNLGIKAETAPGLPAICAPETAGRFISELICKTLSGGDQV